MRGTELLDLINRAEQNFAVDTWEISDIKIWPLVRFQTYFRNIFSGQYCSKPGKGRRKKVISRIVFYADLASSFVSSVFHFRWKAFSFHRDALFLSDGVSNVLLNDKWYDKFCDPLVYELQKRNHSSLLLSPDLYNFRPKHNGYIHIQLMQDFAALISLVCSIPFLKKKKSSNMEDFNNFLDFLKEEKNLHYLPTFQELERQCLKLKFLAGIYDILLRIIKPKVVFLVSYYGDSMALNIACRRLGIPSIDIQHGRQGPEHIAYGKFLRIPPDGYELLPSHFWCWGNYEAETIRTWSRPESKYHKPLVGGNLFLNQWLSSDLDVVRSYDAIIANVLKEKQFQKSVLYTLNGLESKEYLDSLFQVISENKQDYFWWIRFHPCRLNQEEAICTYINNDINLVDHTNIFEANQLPIHSILRNVDFHVTELSSTVIEAYMLGVPSMIIGEEGGKIYDKEIEAGWALSVPNVTSLGEPIKSSFFEVSTKARPGEHDPFNLEENCALNFVLTTVSSDVVSVSKYL